MYSKVISLALMIGSFFASVNAQESTIRTWYVADSKIGCQLGDAVTSCYQLKDSLSGEWRSFPYPIEGFDHEKGFEYVIEVLQEQLKYPEEYGPYFKWTLSKIVSKTSTVFTDKRLLANNTFSLINIEQFGKTTLAVKAKPTIQFNIDSGRIFGFTGCNRFFGPCTYATAFMEFGPLASTKMACYNSAIEDKVMQSLTGRATFYVRKNMLYVVCENHMTLHLKPQRSFDSIFSVIEAEKAPKNDINFFKTEDGLYIVNAPTSDDKAILLFNYKPSSITEKERSKIKLKLKPIGAAIEITEIQILKKPHENPRMYSAIIIYKTGKRKEVEIRDAN